MSDTKLGILLDEAATRDAIHVAVAPVIAAHRLSPGAHVQLTPDGRAATGPNPIGIIDPFLEAVVKPGQRCWLFLYQQTVTGMKHHWAHPSFPEAPAAAPFVPAPAAPDKGVAEQWLRSFASEWGMDYEEMIDEAKSGSYICARGRDLHGNGELGGDWQLFWDHLETVTGQTFSEAHRHGTHFTCSC